MSNLKIIGPKLCDREQFKVIFSLNNFVLFGGFCVFFDEKKKKKKKGLKMKGHFPLGTLGALIQLESCAF